MDLPTCSPRFRRRPWRLSRRCAASRGVEAAAARIVGYGAISIDGFDEPVTGRLVSLPEKDGPPVNGLALRQGRWPAPDRPEEVVVNEGFAMAHGLGAGSRFGLTIGGHRRVVTVAGVALSPEFIFALGAGARSCPTTVASALSGWSALGLATDLGLADQIQRSRRPPRCRAHRPPA